MVKKQENAVRGPALRGPGAQSGGPVFRAGAAAASGREGGDPRRGADGTGAPGN